MFDARLTRTVYVLRPVLNDKVDFSKPLRFLSIILHKFMQMIFVHVCNYVQMYGLMCQIRRLAG